MLLVHITDKGRKVKSNMALFFSGDITKTITPIKNPKISFLYEACNISGLLDKDKIIEKRK